MRTTPRSRAVHEGECVVVYPEGTLTRDPDLWPMTGKSGAARIALATGVPVIPVGHWGAQDVLPPYAKQAAPLPAQARRDEGRGPRADSTTCAARQQTPEVVTETTERIMSAITDIVAELRGEQPPAERFDPRIHGVKPIGNPNKKDRR